MASNQILPSIEEETLYNQLLSTVLTVVVNIQLTLYVNSVITFHYLNTIVLYRVRRQKSNEASTVSQRTKIQMPLPFTRIIIKLQSVIIVWGTWVAQLVESSTLCFGSGHDLIMGLEIKTCYQAPHLVGSLLKDSLPLLPPTHLTHSLS